MGWGETIITSSQNSFIKKLKLLQKSKKQRTKEKVFIVEGLRAVKEIPKGWPIHQYVIAESCAASAGEIIREDSRLVLYVSDSVFASISDTKSPQGIMAVVSQPDYSIDQVISQDQGFFIIADEIQDPGNLGTLLRTAHGAGAHGLFLSKGSVDIYNPKTIRATMGSIFHIPLFIDLDMEWLIPKLITQDTNLYATALEESKMLYDYDYREKTGIIIGNEANGINEKTKELVSNFIKIPMPGNAESLNASIAAGICMFEVVRQRLR